MNDLDEIRRRLVVAVGDEAKFLLINTRLILRTGVNLSDIRPGQQKNPATVAKVLAALQAMGYDFRAA